MDEKGMKDIMYRTVASTCSRLGINELAPLALAVELGTDPRPVVGYSEIKSLFTENNETEMHKETKDAFLTYVYRRMETEA